MATKQKDKPATPSYQYDAIVIGTGPGGEGVAMQLAKAGKKSRRSRKVRSRGRWVYALGHHSI